MVYHALESVVCKGRSLLRTDVELDEARSKSSGPALLRGVLRNEGASVEVIARVRLLNSFLLALKRVLLDTGERCGEYCIATREGNKVKKETKKNSRIPRRLPLPQNGETALSLCN